MMAHIIGEAVFDIVFGPEKEGTDIESNLARMVQSRLLPVIEEVFDEMAVDREVIRIDRLELDLGPVRDDELESELADRLREKLRDVLRDYVLAREKTVVAGKAAPSHRSADLEKLAYFLRYGHLTWNTSVGQPGSVVDLLEEALLQSPDQISRLFEASADFDTVVFRLASQFPGNAVQDLVDRLAKADPELASKVDAALRNRKKESESGPRIRPDELSVIRAYELYDHLRRQLTEGGGLDAAGLGSLLDELLQKYPWQLLRLYRELQAGEGVSARIPDSYGVEDLRRLVDAFLSVVEETTRSIADFRRSIEVFAETSADKKAYYTQVLYRLIRNETLDLEAFAMHSGPVEVRREAGDTDIQSLLADRPERARARFRKLAADPLALRRTIDRTPEHLLLRLLHFLQGTSEDRMLEAADAVIESAHAAGMKVSYPKVALLKWEFLLSSAVLGEESFRTEKFIEELGQQLSDDVPPEARAFYRAHLQDVLPPVPSLSWDLLIRAYELHDLVLQKLEAGEPGEIGTALKELLQKYPLHIRKLYREIQADAGLLMRIQQSRSPADLAGLLEAFLRVLHPVSAVWEAIERRAAQSEDPGRYYGQVLQRLLRTPEAAAETLAAEPSTEESEERAFEGMRLLLGGQAHTIRGTDLLRRFEAILRKRPEHAQQLAVLIRAADAVADTLLSGSASLSEPELFRLKWAFLFRYAIREGSYREPEAFSAAFARHLADGLLSVSERVRRIQLKLWDRARPLDEPSLVEALRSFHSPAVERLLLAADAVADTFYRAGGALPGKEIARLKWQMVFSDALLEEADAHADEFSGNFESLLRDRLAAAKMGKLPVVEPPVLQQLDWNGWVQSYELYDRLRLALVDGKPDSSSGLMAALEETVRLHPWQLLRLYREMQAGDGISVRVKAVYGAGELRRLAEALLTVSIKDGGASRTIQQAIAAFEPHKADDAGLYYYNVLEQLVQVGRTPEFAAQFVAASLPEKVARIQAILKDRSQPLPERFLVHVLSEMDSLAAGRLIQKADSVVDAYYRAGLALPQSEMARLKWEIVFSDALLEETETHAAEFAEHFQVLIQGRLDAAAAAPFAPVSVSAEFEWTSWSRAYQLYARLRRTLVDGDPDSASGVMATIEETLRLYPWQLLRLYREMQAGDGLSLRLKDSYGGGEMRRLAEALLTVSEGRSTAIIDAIFAFELIAEDLRVYYADVLEQLVQTRRPPAFVNEWIEASLPEKVRWIQAKLRDRSQPLMERLFVQVLSEVDSAVIEGLLQTADSVADTYYRADALLPQSEIARLKWSLIFSDALLEEPEIHAAEFAGHFRFLLDERVASVASEQFKVSPVLASGWSVWIRAYELYDRLRRLLVQGKPDTAAALMADLDETLRLHPWQLLRLYREMQAGDGLSGRVETLYGAGELRRIVEAFLTVSEEQAGTFEGLKKSMAAFAQQSKDQHAYYAALLQQLVSAEAIDLELALTLAAERQAEEKLLEASAEWRDLAHSYALYEDLRQALLSPAAVRASVQAIVEELAQSYPWQIRKLFRELESTALQAGILRSRDPGALRSLIAAFTRTVRLDASVAALIQQELANESADDMVQRYSRVLETLIRARLAEVEATGPTPLPPQVDDARDLIRIAEGVLRSGSVRLQGWIEEMLSSPFAAARLVRLLPEELMARMLIAGAPASSPALLLVTSERLALAASTSAVGVSPRRARELKWMFVLRHAIVEKHPFVESHFVKSFAAAIVSEAQSPGVEGLTATLADQMKIDGVPLLVRQEEDKTYGAIELERGIPVLNAGMVLAAPYLPKLFAELNLTEGRKFRNDEARERAVLLLQFMVNESEDTAEYDLVLNKILCGMATSAPVQRRIEVQDREKVMIESLIRGMIQNWTKLGQTSIAGFRESFLQREGTLRLTHDAWQLEVFPKAFDMLLDYIPWTFETIKHPWMDQIVHVQWR